MGSERLEGRIRQEDHRPHRAQPDRRSQRARHPDGQIARRRLHGDDPRRLPWRDRLDPIPGDGRHLDDLGHGGIRHYRGGAVADVRSRRKVRPTMSEPLITARGLTKRYGEAVVVDALDFDILKGETFGLLGPNGAGKTTTILMMLGLTEVSAGTAPVAARAPAPQRPAGQRRVA